MPTNTQGTHKEHTEPCWIIYETGNLEAQVSQQKRNENVYSHAICQKSSRKTLPDLQNLLSIMR